MTRTAVEYNDGPIAFRYPRGSGAGVSMNGKPHTLPIGRGEIIREGSDLTIAAIGSGVLAAERAAEMLAEQGISATVINARFVKPLDEKLILDSVRQTGTLVTVEEAMIHGGFGSAVLELLSREGIQIPTAVIGIPDRIFDHGPQQQLRSDAGIDPDSIVERAQALVKPASVAAS